MVAVPVLQAIGEIFGLFFIGWLTHHFRYLGEAETGRWSRFILDILFPIYIFSSITEGFDTGRLSELWPLPFLGLGLVLFGIFCGYVFQFGIRGSSADLRRTFLHFCAVNNSAYLPIIIVRNLWGESALANLFFFNLGTTVGVWTVGVGVLGELSIRRRLSSLITPNLIAVLAALLISLSGLKNWIPVVIGNVLSTAGSAAVPMMLILIGSSFYRPRLVRFTWPVLYASVIRLAVIPFFTVLILSMLPVSQAVFQITVVVALMPVAVASTIFTIRYGGDPEYAAQTSILTTLASALTVPLALSVLL